MPCTVFSTKQPEVWSEKPNHVTPLHKTLQILLSHSQHKPKFTSAARPSLSSISSVYAASPPAHAAPAAALPRLPCDCRHRLGMQLGVAPRYPLLSFLINPDISTWKSSSQWHLVWTQSHQGLEPHPPCHASCCFSSAYHDLTPMSFTREQSSRRAEIFLFCPST